MNPPILLPFVKMQATGNDFILITYDAFTKSGTRLSLQETSRLICDRHFGIGSDGMICVRDLQANSHGSTKEALEDETNSPEVEMLFFNPDGSDGRMCGNGARCFSQFVWSQYSVMSHSTESSSVELNGNRSLFFQVNGKTYKSVRTQEDPERVTLHFVEPVRVEDFELEEILRSNVSLKSHAEFVQNRLLGAFRVQPGTDHLVLYLKLGSSFLLSDHSKNFSDPNYSYGSIDPDDSLETQHTTRAILLDIAKAIRLDPQFAPNGINVNLIQSIKPDQLELVTYERGVEQATLSCGTGTIAGALAFLSLESGNRVRIVTDGGELIVDCERLIDTPKMISSSDSESERANSEPLLFDSVSLTGPTRTIAHGSFILPS